jgi:hypothetical protein
LYHQSRDMRFEDPIVQQSIAHLNKSPRGTEGAV